MSSNSSGSGSSKRWIILVVFIVVLVIAVLLALYFRPRLPQSPAPSTGTTQQPAPAPAKPTPAEQQEQQIRQSSATLQAAAKLFAERYGSFSTEAHYANLTDTLTLMTAEFAAKTQTSIKTAKPPSEFYGVSTKAVAVKVNASDDKAGTATVTVSTQRVETRGSAAPTTKYQDLVLTFQKVGTDWKVASATWK